MEPLAVVFGVCGAIWGLAADRIAARWPAHEDGSVRRVDWRTPLVAICGALALAAVPVRFADPAERLLFGAVFVAMIALFATDLDQRLMPEVLNLSLIAVSAIALIWVGNSLVNRQAFWLPIVAAVAVPAFMYVLSLPFGEGAFGGGDVEFLFGAGLLVGATRLVLAVFAGTLLMGAVTAALLVTRRITLKSYIPFGPLLIVGVVWSVLLPASS